MTRSSGFATVALLAAIALAACRGGGSSTTAGIDGTGTPTPAANAYSFGTVTAFGSVFVNGVRFDTSGATFSIDGESGSQDQLHVGDVVLVKGTRSLTNANEGTASEVIYDDAVEGPIAAGTIDLAAGTFVVLGQTVSISPDTSFGDSVQPPSISGLSDGDIVEVSGFAASDGSVAATRIEAKSAGAQFDVTGIATQVDGVAFTFMINAQKIDFGSAMIENFPSGMLAEGDLVEVKGTTFGTAGEFVAARVEFKGGRLIPEPDDDVEIEGLITRFGNGADFDVAGFPVRTTAETVYEGGSATDLGLDVKVEVEGSLDTNDVLVAEKVDIRRSSAVRIAALVDSVSPAASSFVTLGITVKVDALTRIEDKRDDVEPFSVASLNAGDYVEVRASEFPAGSGELLATLVERDDPDPDTELRGFVQSVNEPTFTILGVTVSTDAGTQFEDESGGAIAASAFFAQLGAGSLVDIDGLETGSQAVLASDVEIRSQ